MKLKRDWGGLDARQAEEKHLRVGGERKAGGGRRERSGGERRGGRRKPDEQMFEAEGTAQSRVEKIDEK